MSTRTDYLNALDDLVPGDSALTQGNKVRAISQAVREHSRHRVRVVVEDMPGDGGFDYPLAGFSAWSDGFSTVERLEYPVDDDNHVVRELERDQWAIYHKPVGRVLRFLGYTPETDETFRLAYTTLHVCDDVACTVEAFDEEAVQILAAAYCCDFLATYYAPNHDATIQADSVDHTSKSRDYAARAKTYRSLYFGHLGIKEGQTVAASVTADQDSTPSWQGDRITHPARYR
jgi:hypothetical protein